jgi:hypothetical protein
MGSITNALSGLPSLMQPGGLLSDLVAPLSAADLQSASPQDIVSLSLAALQTQEVNVLFGAPQGSQDAAPLLPFASPQATGVLPGVSAADLANATSQEQAAINDQALLLQQVQGLFGEPASVTGTTNVFG